MRLKIVILILAITGCFAHSGNAREVAVKTNLLYDATLSINLGAEMEIAPQWSVDLSGNLNAWTLSHGRRWKHWFLQPEARYWLCEPLGGHFFGAHLIGGQYNVGNIGADFTFLGTNFDKTRHHRYQGWCGGAGIAYGYSWLLNRHWNLEAEIGIGWTHSRFDRFDCSGCGKALDSGHHNYFGPTKLAINIVYVF